MIGKKVDDGIFKYGQSRWLMMVNGWWNDGKSWEMVVTYRYCKTGKIMIVDMVDSLKKTASFG